MISLKWGQVNAWRMDQQCLVSRLPRRDFLQAVSRTGGIQAQVMSAAELAVAARVDGLGPQDVSDALWKDRALIKTWAMRCALHLVAVSDFPLVITARSNYEPRNWMNYFAYFGVTRPQYEALLEAIPQVLGSQPMTREQLADALAEHTGAPAVRTAVLGSGWGSPLKPSAMRGDLCFGPNQGRNVTFVRPSQWIGGWKTYEPYPALQEMARRYFRLYGAATMEGFARWWELRLTHGKKLIQSMAGEFEEVDVEGWRALALREALEPMQELEPTGMVRLLPLFDAYVMGLGRILQPLPPKAYESQVYRIAGWISAVVLVDGFMQGVWDYKTHGAQTDVKVRMFSPPAPAIKEGIAAEAERLGGYLNSKVELEIE